VRTASPDGRHWEIYTYKLQLPSRPLPDPAVGDLEGYRVAAASALLDGVIYLLAFIPRLLIRLFIDLPVAAVRASRSDEWTIEAVSWAPYPVHHKWSTTSEFRGQVLATVEGSLARGETPKPRHALQLESR
jgi:hypothetical protein